MIANGKNETRKMASVMCCGHFDLLALSLLLFFFPLDVIHLMVSREFQSIRRSINLH